MVTYLLAAVGVCLTAVGTGYTKVYGNSPKIPAEGVISPVAHLLAALHGRRSCLKVNKPLGEPLLNIGGGCHVLIEP